MHKNKVKIKTNCSVISEKAMQNEKNQKNYSFSCHGNPDIIAAIAKVCLAKAYPAINS